MTVKEKHEVVILDWNFYHQNYLKYSDCDS